MAKIVLIGDQDTVLGFGLAGLHGHVAQDATEASRFFGQAVRRPDVSIIVITERLARLIRAELDAFSEVRDSPFILEIPDSEGPLPDRKSPSDMVREAVGISI
jgi:V/A-type H+-transporting ATPase subunit F